jgi:cytochrome bd-type quinol oxidase subunit 2
MSTTHDILRNQVSRAALSVALIVCSGLWLVAACEYYAVSGFKVDWSATPLFWMLTVVVTPAICFAGCMILVDQRKERPFGLMEWWALVAAFLPVTLGTLLSVWAVKVLLLMRGL